MDDSKNQPKIPPRGKTEEARGKGGEQNHADRAGDQGEKNVAAAGGPRAHADRGGKREKPDDQIDHAASAVAEARQRYINVVRPIMSFCGGKLEQTRPEAPAAAITRAIRSCGSNRIKRDDDSKKSHPDLSRGATYRFAARALCRRNSRRSSRARPGLRTSLMSLTNLAPPRRRSSRILRLWKASSSGRCPTLTSVVCSGRSLKCAISSSWLLGSSAAVASSSTMMSGLCRKMRANARRCFSPPESVWSQGPSSSRRSTRWSSPTRRNARAMSSTLWLSAESG